MYFLLMSIISENLKEKSNYFDFFKAKNKLKLYQLYRIIIEKF